VTVVGIAELPAQAISIVAATPLNFLGNKMWSFAIEVARD
jgi:putative flippase GtrA